MFVHFLFIFYISFSISPIFPSPPPFFLSMYLSPIFHQFFNNLLNLQVPPPGTHMFCVASKEAADKLIEFRKQQSLRDTSQTARVTAKKEELELRSQAIAALTEETGRGQFNKNEIQTKIAQLQKQKEEQNNKTVISVILKADVAGSLEG